MGVGAGVTGVMHVPNSTHFDCVEVLLISPQQPPNFSHFANCEVDSVHHDGLLLALTWLIKQSQMTLSSPAARILLWTHHDCDRSSTIKERAPNGITERREREKKSRGEQALSQCIIAVKNLPDSCR